MFAEGKMHHSASLHHIPSALRKKTTSFCVETRMTPFPLCWDQSKVLFENSRSLEYWGCPLDASATGRRGASVGPDEVQWSHGRCMQHANLFLFVLQCGGPEMDEMTMDDWDGSSRPTVSVEFQENILGKEVADWGFRCSFFFDTFTVWSFSGVYVSSLCDKASVGSRCWEPAIWLAHWILSFLPRKHSPVSK